MPKYAVHSRFLALFLLLTFMLISMAVLPAIAGMNSSNSIDVSQPDKTDGSASLSLAVFNCFDYLDAENISFKIGSSQSFQTRRLIEEGCNSLSSALPSAYSDISFAAFSFEELNGRFSLNKITEFLHAKDGMI